MNDYSEETTIIPAETNVPPMRALLAPPGNFESYMVKLWRTTEKNLSAAESAVESRQDDLAAAKEHAATLEHLIRERTLDPYQGQQQVELAVSRIRGAKMRLTRALTAVRQLTAFRGALETGYVPLPRMPAISLRWVRELMPPDVLDSLKEAKSAGVFDEFRLVTGGEATPWGYPNDDAHLQKGRDPILVGMIGDEMFAVAWWR